MTDMEVDTLARTLWGEARGEGQLGMQAVACVILNRANKPRWWGHDIGSCCLKPYQFSCWLADDPNLPKMHAVTTADPAFVQAVSIARLASKGALSDVTHGADSYYAAGTPVPAWSIGRTPVAVIGHHRFYKTI